ncbi:MAG: hypothetical protein K8S25_05990 [Alphaproteobacteria bacterium]|nr:hypothetical protein [Alphaproteobacteria bacterium]
MTSEVMLLNVQGGALAADSALTAIEYHKDGTASVRYQTGIEKIYVVDEKLPVASMIFDVAEFYRYPWSTIFEAFKTAVPSSGTTVTKVTQSLVEFLGRWTSGADAKAQSLLPLEEGQERLSFAIYVAAIVQRFYQCAELSGGQSAQKPQVLSRALDMLRFETTHSGDYFQNLFLPHGDTPSRRPIVGESSPRLVALLDQYLDRLLTGMLKAMFGDNAVPDETKAALAAITVSSCLTDWIPPGVPKTGIVFAGYGASDVRPMYVEILIGSAFGGIVKHQLVASGAPNQREPVIIRSFAQADLIDALLRGAQPGYKYVLFQLMRQGIGALLNAVGGEIAKKDTGLAKSILQTFDQAPLAVARAIIMAGDDIARHAMEMRVAEVVSSAAPELLADYASKLVRLSVIEHELTGSQTVAEPIIALYMKKGHIERVKAKSV